MHAYERWTILQYFCALLNSKALKIRLMRTPTSSSGSNRMGAALGCRICRFFQGRPSTRTLDDAPRAPIGDAGALRACEGRQPEPAPSPLAKARRLFRQLLRPDAIPAHLLAPCWRGFPGTTFAPICWRPAMGLALQVSDQTFDIKEYVAVFLPGAFVSEISQWGALLTRFGLVEMDSTTI